MDNAEDNHDILNKLCFILFKVSLCPVPTYLRMPKRNICLKIEFFPIILILFYHHFIFSEGPPFLALLVSLGPWTSELRIFEKEIDPSLRWIYSGELRRKIMWCLVYCSKINVIDMRNDIVIYMAFYWFVFRTTRKFTAAASLTPWAGMKIGCKPFSP